MDPYKNLKSLELWKVIDKGIEDLEKNKDIKVLTVKDYIIGYLVKKILQNTEEDKKEEKARGLRNVEKRQNEGKNKNK